MAYDEHLADRIRAAFQQRHRKATEKKMMGGLCFMISDKMCVGILKHDLMVRVAPEFYADALRRRGCKSMDFTGRVLKGFVLVEPEGIDLDTDFDFWIDHALQFNPRAKASKKTKASDQ